MSAPAQRPEGLRVSMRYTNHRGEERLRQVIVTGRVEVGPTEWHSDAAWTFEGWDQGLEAFRMFDPRGVTGDPLPLVLQAAQARDDRQRRQMAADRAHLEGERSCRQRAQSKAWESEQALRTARGALRSALAELPALERRRDELLETANRYLGRARRLRAWIEASHRAAREPGALGRAKAADTLAAALDGAADACRAD